LGGCFSTRPRNTIEANLMNKRRIGAKIMTDKERFTDRGLDQAIADDSPHAHRAPGRRRWTDVLMHRWPTAPKNQPEGGTDAN
jgi:hypothetical protein